MRQAAMAWALTAALLAMAISSTTSDGSTQTGRQLQAAAPSSSSEENVSWTGKVGRVSYTNPSLHYQDQIVNSTDSSGLGIGSCNLYNGQQADANRSRLTVPVQMQAGLAMDNADFAGSCGRCYQLRCVSGPTVGNSTSNGTRSDLPLALADPPYIKPTVNNQPLQDDANRTFPGNAGAASEVLDVQCWNDSAQPIIQITDSCQCDPPVSSNPCCTNIEHFNIDYSAFQMLAHPGYGLISVEYRPVMCPADLSAMPRDTPDMEPSPFPQFNSTIISGHVESGWQVQSWAGKNETGFPIANAITQELQASLKRHNTTTDAVCFTFDLTKANKSAEVVTASTAFECRNCDISLQPFAINSTAGLQFDIAWAQNDTGGEYAFLRNGFPPLTVGTADKDGSPLTSLGAFPVQPNSDVTGMITTTLLYQDWAVLAATPSGLHAQQQATRVTFGYNTSADVDKSDAISFCLANLQLLPSTLNSSVGLPPVPKGPDPVMLLNNCPFSSPQPMDLNGSLVAVWPSLEDVTNGTTSEASYTVFEHTDNANQFGIFPNETCSNSSKISPSALSLINKCAHNPDLAGAVPQCCYPFDSVLDFNPLDGAFIAATLGPLCDGILFQNDSGSYVCNGFNYNTESHIAFFKASLVDQPIPGDAYCNSPNVTTWMLQTDVEQGDTRAVAAEARHPTSKAGSWSISKIWTLAGAIGGIASAGAALGLWIILTNSYRLQRQMILQQISQQITEGDITAASTTATDVSEGTYPTRSGSIPNPLLWGTGSFDPTDSNAGLMDAAVLGAAVGTMSRGGSTGVSDEARKVAKQITNRCLQRWDGFMGLRADNDSLGNKSGIWKMKFDCVRGASMLLAMRRYNEHLADSHAGSLMKTWQQSNRQHQTMIITQLGRVLQSISEEEAQALPAKDPETGGINEKLCSMWHACGTCFSCSRFNVGRLNYKQWKR